MLAEATAVTSADVGASVQPQLGAVSPSRPNARPSRQSVAGTIASVRSNETTGNLADQEEEGGQSQREGTTLSSHRSSAHKSMAAKENVPPLPPLPPGVDASPHKRRLSLRRDRSHNKSASDATAPTETAVKRPQTLGALYLVSGLSRDPLHWQLSEVDGGSPAHSSNAVQRWWKPEVLGTAVAGDAEGIGLSSLDGRSGRKSKRAPTRMSRRPSHSQLLLNKEEVARIQAKAMKLSFIKDVEVIATTVAPPSTVHSFSFSITSSLQDNTNDNGSMAQAWDMMKRPSNVGREQTFHAATLIIYSHADKLRTDAIRASIEASARGKSAAIDRAIRAAGAGRKLGRKLETRMAAVSLISNTPERLNVNDTEDETEACHTESDWEGPQSNISRAATTILPTKMPMWLPYALTIVSRWPIYELMLDVLRISWARYHLSISEHSRSMLRFINTPAPAAGSMIKVPAGTDGTTFFSSLMPQPPDIPVLPSPETTQVLWPLFRAISSDNLLTICEIALAPLGRVILFSQYPTMLSIAVQGLKAILQMQGWSGVAHSAIHSRDVGLMLEDPGPYLLALHNSQRPLAHILAPEILVVDLDTDRVQIDNPPPHVLTRGGMRLRIRRRLEAAIGDIPVHAVPAELFEAFPGGRFRPFSAVEVNGQATPAERLLPSWNYDQQRVMITLAEILGSKPSSGLRRLFFRQSQLRKPIRLDASTLHIQSIVRHHANAFVDRRDLLEARIGKLNRRLGYLISESSEWQGHFDTFRAFSDRLAKEGHDLKNRLEHERKEARRLSGSLRQQEHQREALTQQLMETERAKTAAENEIKRMERIRRHLEEQRDAVVAEVAGLASPDEASLIVDGVFNSLDSASVISRRPSTSLSAGMPGLFDSHAPLSLDKPSGGRLRGLSTASTIGPSISESGRDRRMDSLSTPSLGQSEGPDFDLDGEVELGDFERASLQREAVMETMRSIQSRLQRALLNAGIDRSMPITESAAGDSDHLQNGRTNKEPSPIDTASKLSPSLSSTLLPTTPVPKRRPLTAETEDGYVSAAERSATTSGDSDTEIRHANRKPMKGVRPLL